MFIIFWIIFGDIFPEYTHQALTFDTKLIIIYINLTTISVQTKEYISTASFGGAIYACN